jgi:hypothetical protein
MIAIQSLPDVNLTGAYGASDQDGTVENLAVMERLRQQQDYS